MGSARWHAGTLSARAGASAGLRRTRAASMLVLAPPAILPVRASLNTCVHAAGDSSTAPANLPLKVLKLFEKCSKFRKVFKVFKIFKSVRVYRSSAFAAVAAPAHGTLAHVPLVELDSGSMRQPVCCSKF